MLIHLPSAFALQSTILLGDSSVESQAVSLSTGQAQAFPVKANSNGTITGLSVYVGDGSTSMGLQVGIYENFGSHPGQLLAKGSKGSLTAGTWNSVALSGLTVISGTKYWLAILDTAGGNLGIRASSTSTCRIETSSEANLTSLPANWQTGSVLKTACPVAAYGSGGALVSTGNLSATPSSVKFGNVRVGSTSTQLVTLTDTGTASVNISQAAISGSGFSISGLTLPLTLAPNQSITFSAIFAPASTAAVTANISISSDAFNAPTVIALSGTGVTGVLSSAASSVNFGNVIVGTSSLQSVILTDTGTADLTISLATVTGAGFSISGLTFPLTLLSGQSRSFDVTFAPASTGSFTGNITIVSDASNSPTNEALSGSGTLSHTVTLAWNPSASANVVGYNVYRGSTSGGPYTTINSSLIINKTSFIDATALAGQTYFYVATAVDNNNVESQYSNEVRAIIPMP